MQLRKLIDSSYELRFMIYDICLWIKMAKVFYEE